MCQQSNGCRNDATEGLRRVWTNVDDGDVVQTRRRVQFARDCQISDFDSTHAVVGNVI